MPAGDPPFPPAPACWADQFIARWEAERAEAISRVRLVVDGPPLGHPVLPSYPKSHRFERRPWWWLRRKENRWQCRVCGLVTRHYDSLDRWMGRPVHKFMAVAFRGVNAQ